MEARLEQLRARAAARATTAQAAPSPPDLVAITTIVEQSIAAALTRHMLAYGRGNVVVAGTVQGGVLSHDRIPGSDEDLSIVSTPERTADWKLRSTLLQESVRQVRDRGGRVRAISAL